jgi:hypothetical protein
MILWMATGWQENQMKKTDTTTFQDDFVCKINGNRSSLLLTYTWWKECQCAATARTGSSRRRIVRVSAQHLK